MNTEQERLAALIVEIREKARKQREDLEALDLDALVASGQLIPREPGWYDVPGDLPAGAWHLATEASQTTDGRLKVKLANRDQMLKLLREI